MKGGATIRCTVCGHELSTDSFAADESVACPKCQHRFTLPREQLFAEKRSAGKESRNAGPADRSPPTGRTDCSPSRTRSGNPLGQLGRFRLEQLLGQGSYGRVYKAYDPQLDRYVALKVPTFAARESLLSGRFLREAKAAAQLRHPHIVPTFESGKLKGNYFIASQFIDGQTLADRIEAGRVGVVQAAGWTLQLAEALSYAHSMGIVHRDIKPANIMLDENDEPQIMDFGLAKREGESSRMTSDGSVLGTPAYMAPEQARGDTASVGPPSDQYSLAVVLYELLTGELPFSGPPHAVLADVIRREPAGPRQRRPQVPKDLDAICQKAMSKAPPQRYDDMAALADDLRAWLAGAPVEARPLRPYERLARWCRRSPRVAAAVAAATGSVLLVLVVSVVLTLVQQRSLVTLRERQDALQRQRNESVKARERARRESARAAQEEKRALKLAGEIQANIRIARQKEEEAEAARRRAEEATRKANEEAEVARTALEELQREMKARQEAEATLSGLQQSTAAQRQQLDDILRKDSFALYRDRLRRAAALLRQNQAEDARRLLADCPPSLRHWEWEYLSTRCAASTEDHHKVLTTHGVATEESSHWHNCSLLRFSDQGYALLAAAVPRTIMLCDVPRFHCVYHDVSGSTRQGERDYSSNLGYFALFADGSQLVLADRQRKHHWRWDGIEIHSVEKFDPCPHSRSNICFSKTGQLLGVTANYSRTNHTYLCELVDMNSGKTVARLPEAVGNGCLLVHQGRSVLLRDGSIYEVRSRKWTQPSSPPADCPQLHLDFAPPQTRGTPHFAVENGYARVAGRLLHIGRSGVPAEGIKVLCKGLEDIADPAIHPDGRRLVFAWQQELVFIDVASGREVFRMPWREEPSPKDGGELKARSTYHLSRREPNRFPLTFSPDGTMLAGIGYGTFRILAARSP